MGPGKFLVWSVPSEGAQGWAVNPGLRAPDESAFLWATGHPSCDILGRQGSQLNALGTWGGGRWTQSLPSGVAYGSECIFSRTPQPWTRAVRSWDAGTGGSPKSPGTNGDTACTLAPPRSRSPQMTSWWCQCQAGRRGRQAARLCHSRPQSPSRNPN